jgi:hypothetical protein
VKTEPLTPKTAGVEMEVENEAAAEGAGETVKVKSWQLKKKLPGCMYDTFMSKILKIILNIL